MSEQSEITTFLAESIEITVDDDVDTPHFNTARMYAEGWHFWSSYYAWDSEQRTHSKKVTLVFWRKKADEREGGGR